MNWVLDYMQAILSTLFQCLEIGFNKLGVWKFVFGLFGLYSGYRFILMPLLGGSLNFSFPSSKRKSRKNNSSKHKSQKNNSGGRKSVKK